MLCYVAYFVLHPHPHPHPPKRLNAYLRIRIASDRICSTRMITRRLDFHTRTDLIHTSTERQLRLLFSSLRCDVIRFDSKKRIAALSSSALHCFAFASGAGAARASAAREVPHPVLHVDRLRVPPEEDARHRAQQTLAAPRTPAAPAGRTHATAPSTSPSTSSLLLLLLLLLLRYASLLDAFAYVKNVIWVAPLSARGPSPKVSCLCPH